MAATIRLTSVEGGTQPFPKVWLTSVAGIVDANVRAVRLTSVAGNAPASSSVVRLTSVSGTTSFQREEPVAAAQDLDVASAEAGQMEGAETTTGTIVSRLWTQDSKTVGAPDLVLSDYTIADPTFTAPISSTEYTYAFTYQVTDDLGLTGEDTIEVVVRGGDLAVANGASRVPAGIRAAMTGEWV